LVTGHKNQQENKASYQIKFIQEDTERTCIALLDSGYDFNIIREDVLICKKKGLALAKQMDFFSIENLNTCASRVYIETNLGKTEI
jgi:hypothetical protein